MTLRPTISFDFGDGLQPVKKFAQFNQIIIDRGSRYSASIGLVQNRADIQTFIDTIKADVQYAEATHNSWAARISHDGAIYETMQDDGEVGAGLVILRVLQRRGIVNVAVCVTRWFGGIKLENDRYRHVRDAAELAVDRGCT